MLRGRCVLECGHALAGDRLAADWGARTRGRLRRQESAAARRERRKRPTSTTLGRESQAGEAQRRRCRALSSNERCMPHFPDAWSPHDSTRFGLPRHVAKRVFFAVNESFSRPGSRGAGFDQGCTARQARTRGTAGLCGIRRQAMPKPHETAAAPGWFRGRRIVGGSRSAAPGSC